MITYMLLGRTLGIVVQVYMVSTFEIDLKVSIFKFQFVLFASILVTRLYN